MNTSEPIVENPPAVVVEPAPAPFSPYTALRTMIAAVVAMLNVHSNNAQDLASANAKISDLNDQLAKARAAAIANEGDPLTFLEQVHFNDVLAHLATLPAPVVPVPAPPAVIDPVKAAADAQVAADAKKAADDAAAKDKVAPHPTDILGARNRLGLPHEYDEEQGGPV